MNAWTAVTAALADARRGLSLRRRRAVLSAVGIALAAAMLSAALVIADGLGRGFDRAARAADLPDLLVRFDPVAAHTVTRRITALPDIAAYSLRLELTNVGIAATGHRRGDAVAEVIGPGRRTGYAIVAGRDLRSVGSEVLLERGFAQAWGVQLGDSVLRRGTWASARRRVRRGARQRRLSARQAALLRVSRGDRRALRPRAGSPREPGRDLVARSAVPEPGARAGALDELRLARHPDCHPCRDPDPARPGGRNRDRPAGRAVADRAGDRRGDARRRRAGGGAATAAGDRSAPRARRPARPHRARARARGCAGRGPRGDRRAGGRGAGDRRGVGPSADAPERACARNGAGAAAARRLAAQRRDPGRRHLLAGVAGGRRVARQAASRRRRVHSGRSSRALLTARRWPGRARSAPRRCQARAVGRDHRYARPLDRVRTAAALARLRAAHARDRSGGARQALPADRVAAARARAAGARRSPASSSPRRGTRSRRPTRSRSARRST